MSKLRQTVVKKLSKQEKKKEGYYLLAGFGIFFLIYFLSIIIGSFEWMGYIAAIAIIYIIYRTIVHSDIRYYYQISDGVFSVSSRKNGKKSVVCNLFLTQITDLFLSDGRKTDYTAVSDENASINCVLLWKEDEKEKSLLFEPNESILKVLKAHSRCS